MLAVAAARFGLKTPSIPTIRRARLRRTATHGRELRGRAARAICGVRGVVTCEFENVPAERSKFVALGPVFPPPVVAVARPPRREAFRRAWHPSLPTPRPIRSRLTPHSAREAPALLNTSGLAMTARVSSCPRFSDAPVLRRSARTRAA